MSMLQNLSGDYVHQYKNEQGGFCSGGDFVHIPMIYHTHLSWIYFRSITEFFFTFTVGHNSLSI